MPEARYSVRGSGMRGRLGRNRRWSPERRQVKRDPSLRWLLLALGCQVATLVNLLRASAMLPDDAGSRLVMTSGLVAWLVLGICVAMLYRRARLAEIAASIARRDREEP